MCIRDRATPAIRVEESGAPMHSTAAMAAAALFQPAPASRNSTPLKMCIRDREK